MRNYFSKILKALSKKERVYKGGLLVDVCRKCGESIRTAGEGLLHYECGCGSSLTNPNEIFIGPGYYPEFPKKSVKEFVKIMKKHKRN